MKLLLGAAIIGGALVAIAIIPFSLNKIDSNTAKMARYIKSSSEAINNGENLLSQQNNKINNENNIVNNQNNKINNLENNASNLQNQINSLQSKYQSIINSIGPSNSSNTSAYDNAEFVKCIRSVNPSNESEVNQLISEQNQVENLIYDDAYYNITSYEPSINEIEGEMKILENQILS